MKSAANVVCFCVFKIYPANLMLHWTKSDVKWIQEDDDDERPLSGLGTKITVKSSSLSKDTPIVIHFLGWEYCSHLLRINFIISNKCDIQRIIWTLNIKKFMVFKHKEYEVLWIKGELKAMEKVKLIFVQ